MNRYITTSLGRLGGACAGVALLACAGPGAGVAPQPAGAAAAPDAAGAMAAEAWGSADAYYALGRSQYAARRYAAALDAYRQALRREPGHRDAGNGLAVLYAERGDYAAAIALWRDLTAQRGASDPRAAFLFGNLGYAYLLSGQPSAAVTALEQACLLAPLNASHWTHLASALEQTGQGERAVVMRRQAQTLQTHDVRADYALARQGGLAPTAAPSVAAAAPASDEMAWPADMARNEVIATSIGLLELRRVPGRAAQAGDAGLPARLAPPAAGASVPLAAAAPAGPRPPPGLPLPLRLDIRNGNGVAGMAGLLARTVAGVGDMRVVKVANAADFQVARTRIEYGPQHELAAMAFAARLGSSSVIAQPDCRNADLRVVIGRDLTDPAALRSRYLKQLKLASIEPVKLAAGGQVASR